MTPAQQTALQALYTAHGGAAFTAAQITALTNYVSVRDDASAAAYLSTTPPLTVQTSIPIASFLAWSASTGMRAVIEDAAHLSTSPYYATLRSPALAMLDIISNKTDLDVSTSTIGQGNIALLGAWVNAGAISAAQEAALLAMATQPVTISVAQVSQALIGV